MAFGRNPGPYGIGGVVGCVLNPGPVGGHRHWDTDFPHITPGPMGTGGDLAVRLAIQRELAEGESDLELLVRVYGGVADRHARSYSSRKKGKTEYRAADYVADRHRFFGGVSEYADFLGKARAELDEDDAALRFYVEPPKSVRTTHSDWQQAQDIFYAWVKKAFEKSSASIVDGKRMDFATVIRSQMSEKLKAALKTVRSDYGQKFKSGGFNPRPQKRPGRYLLGTISDHAFGTAVDIEDATNPQIEQKTWKAILKFTGKSLDQAKSKWEKNPEELHTIIKGINDEFVSKLEKTVKETREAASKAAAAPKATDKDKSKAAAVEKDPLAAAIEQNADLEAIGPAFVRKWRNGFFTLPWALVKELHEEGFTWGATFSDVDLHHFEL